MKARNILMTLGASLLLPLYLASCGEDRWAAYAEETASARWIYDTMRVHYYWNEEMPDFDHANFFQAPATFFKSLLSSEDKFSTIDSLQSATRSSLQDASYSYGFDFQLVSLKGTTYAHVLYALKGSPAQEAHLQRGTWIASVDGEAISKENYHRLYGGPSVRLQIGRYDETGDSICLLQQSVSLPAARAVDDNPILASAILTPGSTPIGYLAYNHFTAGPTSGSNAYNRQLLQTSAEWAEKGVKELVLDLRYNTGGAVSCANLLCTILAPATALGDTLGTLVFNNSHRPRQQKMMLHTDWLQGIGRNLNLQRLYVLTGSYTASASELVINCLKPFMEVVLIGQKTVGKNMGSQAFQNEELMLEMHPLVCRLYNSLWESDYTSGFTPDYSLDENSDLAHFYPLGNADETLLAKALSLISGASDTGASSRSTFSHLTLLTSGSTFQRSQEAETK